MSVPRAIDQALQAAVHDGVFPGAVLAVRISGNVKFVAVAGRLCCDETGPFVRTDTVYDLASLTKPLATTTSILLLIQASKFSLDNRIQSILPELAGSPIGLATIRQLLSHCAGLPGWRPIHERLEARGITHEGAGADAVRQAVVELIRDEPLVYEPESKSIYSDLGFMLLGFIVERVGELPLDRWFHANVAGSLGAAPLLYHPLVPPSAADGGGAMVDRSVIAPTERAGTREHPLCGEVHDDNALAMGGVAGHAGLFGTAEAVLEVSGAWLRAIQGRASLLEQPLARAFTERWKKIPQSSWALGWDTPSAPSSSGTLFSPSSFGHLGYTGTSVWVDPERSVEVVLLSNRVHPSSKNDKIRLFRPAIHDLVIRECGLAN
jgi:CubicO group peptidase (beta-lactamase class C family)